MNWLENERVKKYVSDYSADTEGYISCTMFEDKELNELLQIVAEEAVKEFIGWQQKRTESSQDKFGDVAGNDDLRTVPGNR